MLHEIGSKLRGVLAGKKEARWEHVHSYPDEGDNLLLPADPGKQIRNFGNTLGVDFKLASGRDELWGTQAGKDKGSRHKSTPKDVHPTAENARRERIVGGVGGVGFAPHVAPLDGTTWQPLIWPNSAANAAGHGKAVGAGAAEAVARIRDHLHNNTSAPNAQAQDTSHAQRVARVDRMMQRLRKTHNQTPK